MHNSSGSQRGETTTTTGAARSRGVEEGQDRGVWRSSNLNSRKEDHEEQDESKEREEQKGIAERGETGRLPEAKEERVTTEQNV